MDSIINHIIHLNPQIYVSSIYHKKILSSVRTFFVCSLLFYVTVLTISAQDKNDTIASDRAMAIVKELRDMRSKKIFVIAHRADWRNTAENSVEAIQGSIAMGIDVAEIDIAKTKDGKLVLMHDQTIDRTTTGKGKVSDWTLDSLKTLFLLNGLGRPTTFKIPTLEEAMMAAKGKILINLDKCYDLFDDAYNVLEKTGTTYQVIIKGNKPVAQVKKDFAAYLPKIIYMPIIDLNKTDAQQRVAEFQRELKPLAIEFIFEKDTAPFINLLEDVQRRGTRVWINSLWPSLNGGHDDDRALTDIVGSYQWLIDKGASLIQTDRPELLLDFLEKVKRRG